jgi:DNA primase
MSLDEKKERKQEIIYSTSMYDVLAQYGVTVKRRMCRCMFHHEKNPSMKVFKDGVQCFVCGKNWNVFDVVMQLNHCDFNTAFDLLGGNSKTSWQSYAVASRARKKREQEVELESYRNRLLKQQRTKVMALRGLIESEEPYSDLWCESQNKLVYSEYVLDQMMSEVSM